MLVDHVADQAPQNPNPALENAFVAHYGFEFAPAPKSFGQKLADWFSGPHKDAVEHWLAW